MAPIAEGSNILTVTIKPLTVGRAVSARFRLKVQNVQDSFSSCEDNVSPSPIVLLRNSCFGATAASFLFSAGVKSLFDCFAEGHVVVTHVVVA